MSGRGRGRGRGRGGPMGPVARDDDGTMLEAACPPTLFPDITVPSRLEGNEMDGLMREQKKLNDFWRGSVYKLNAGDQADDVPAYAKLERWSDRQGRKQVAGSLQQAMTLDPTFFPQELYSAKDKRVSALAACAAAQRAYWAAAANPDSRPEEDRAAAIMTLLDRQEERARDGDDVASPSRRVKREDGEEGDEEEEEEEEEEDAEAEVEGDEDDDYLQGTHMDDDEGYEDPYADDDGGDQAYM